MTNEASVLLKTNTHNKALDADAALQDLGSDLIGEAYVTASLTVWDEDARAGLVAGSIDFPLSGSARLQDLCQPKNLLDVLEDTKHRAATTQ